MFIIDNQICVLIDGHLIIDSYVYYKGAYKRISTQLHSTCDEQQRHEVILGSCSDMSHPPPLSPSFWKIL